MACVVIALALLLAYPTYTDRVGALPLDVSTGHPQLPAVPSIDREPAVRLQDPGPSGFAPDIPSDPAAQPIPDTREYSDNQPIPDTRTDPDTQSPQNLQESKQSRNSPEHPVGEDDPEQQPESGTSLDLHLDADHDDLFPATEPFPEATVIPEVLPPVILDQTVGPVYIRDNNQYERVWCYAPEGATVSWMYNDCNITQRTQGGACHIDHSIQFTYEDRGRCLVIRDRGRAIDGYLQCYVTNAKGTTFGQPVYIAHAVLQMTEDGEHLTHIEATEGDHVTLSCQQHIEHVPDALVTWHHNHTLVDYSKRSNFLCNGGRTICVLNTARPADSGRYKCGFRIPDGPGLTFKLFELRVRSRLDFNPYTVHPLNLISHVSSPSLVEARLESDVTLVCAFRGSPGGAVTWTFSRQDPDGCHVADLRMTSGEQATGRHQVDWTLLLSHVTEADSGHYTCVADNGYDRYSHRITLAVVAPPVLNHRILSVPATSGGSVRINCSAMAIPEVSEVMWWVNAERVIDTGLGRFWLEEGGHVLVLHDAELQDTSSVTCNVSNGVGSSLGYRQLEVKEPSPTTGPSVTEKQTVTMTIPTTAVIETGTSVIDNSSPIEHTSAKDDTLVTEDMPAKVTTSEEFATHSLSTSSFVTRSPGGGHVAPVSTVDTGYVVPVSTVDTRQDTKNGYEIENDNQVLGANGVIGQAAGKTSQSVTWTHYLPWVALATGLVIGVVIGGLLVRRHYQRRMHYHKRDGDREPDIANIPLTAGYKHVEDPSAVESEAMMNSNDYIRESVT